MRAAALALLLAAGIGTPLVSGGPVALPIVTAPATGAGTDTCTGAGCGVGPGGFSTDSGVVIKGRVNRNTIGNGGGNFNLYQLVLMPQDFNGTTSVAATNNARQCIDLDISLDGGLLCVLPISASNTPTDDTALFGSFATGANGAATWPDGGNIAPSTFIFGVDDRAADVSGTGISRSIQLTSRAAADLSIRVDATDAGIGTLTRMEAVLIMRGNFSGTPVIEVGTTTLIAGTKAIVFNTGYSAAPTCQCNDTTGAATACSTDVPLPAGFNIFGTTTHTVSWMCVGPR